MKTQTKCRLFISNVILIALAMTIGFISQQCTRTVANEENTSEQNAIPIKIAQERIQYLVQPLELSGMVVASKEQRLSFKTGGFIESILVNEGQSVRKGQLLATLRLDEIEAEVNQAQLGLSKATRDYERVKNLFNDSVATLEQLQNTTTALDIAKSNVKIAEYNRRFSKIEAPTNGFVLKKLYESNELVGPGMPVLMMASNEQEWQIQTAVTDKEVVRISLNDSASILLDAYPNENIWAMVLLIGDAPDPMTGLYEIKLSLGTNKLELKPGFFANVSVYPASKKGYVTIPINSVTEGIGNSVTYYSISDDGTKAIKKTAPVEWIQNDLVVLGSPITNTGAVVIESQKALTHLARIEVIE